MKLRVACLALFPLLAMAQTPAQVRQHIDDWNVEAAVTTARALVATVSREPSRQHAEALDLLGESLSLAGDPAALQVLDDALRLKSTFLPSGDISFAETHLRRAAERGLRREWPAALDDYQKALAIVDGRPGDTASALRPLVLSGIGSVANTLGRNKEAKAALDQALLAAEKQFGADSRVTRAVLRALSTLAYLAADLDLAEQYLARAKPSPPAHPVENIQFLLLSAGLAMERGRYDEASTGLLQARAFFEARLGPRNRRLLPVVRNIARCHRFQTADPPARPPKPARSPPRPRPSPVLSASASAANKPT